MKARVRRRGDKRAERVEVRTFHSFCYHLLQQHQEALQVLDEIDYWIFLRRRLDRLRLKVFRKLSEPGRFLGDFTDFFSRCQDELISPDEYSNYVADLREALGRESELLNEEEREERARRIGPPTAVLSSARWSCCEPTRRCVNTTRRSIATSWWMSSRTPTLRRSSCCGCSPAGIAT
jgi:hypothetical protein